MYLDIHSRADPTYRCVYMRERERQSCGGAILDKLGDIVDLGKGTLVR